MKKSSLTHREMYGQPASLKGANDSLTEVFLDTRKGKQHGEVLTVRGIHARGLSQAIVLEG